MRQLRVIQAALSALLVVSLAACSSGAVEPVGARPGQTEPARNLDRQPTKLQPAPLDGLDFEAQGLRVGTPVAEVKKQLGEPTGSDYVKGIGADVLVYDPLGLKVYFYRGTGLVTGWSIQERSTLVTKRGIRIGATKEEVLAAYGKSTSTESDDDRLFYASPDDPIITLGFDLYEGKVRAIAVGGDFVLW